MISNEENIIKPVWFSVKDKIPNDNRMVLGTDGKKYEIVRYVNSYSEWFGAIGDFGYLLIVEKVTHWMDLPELPEKKDKP